jgi:hypothetical protein
MAALSAVAPVEFLLFGGIVAGHTILQLPLACVSRIDYRRVWFASGHARSHLLLHYSTTQCVQSWPLTRLFGMH